MFRTISKHKICLFKSVRNAFLVRKFQVKTCPDSLLLLNIAVKDTSNAPVAIKIPYKQFHIDRHHKSDFYAEFLCIVSHANSDPHLNLVI